MSVKEDFIEFKVKLKIQDGEEFVEIHEKKSHIPTLFLRQVGDFKINYF